MTGQGGETFVKRFFNVLVSARHEAHYFYAGTVAAILVVGPWTTCTYD